MTKYKFVLKFALFGLLFMFSLNINSQSFSSIDVNPFGLDEGKTLVSDRVYFADIDGDGDLDHFAPSYGIMYFARNIGNAQNPVFANVLMNPFGLSSPTSVSGLDFVDIDNDGDLDIYQMDDTQMLFHKNNGTATNPSFASSEIIDDVSNDLSRVLGWNITSDNIVKEAFVSIDFIDIDNDGDQDLFAGGYSGDVFCFRNTGTSLVPAFAPMQTNPFGFSGFGTYQFAFPSFADIDNDGDQDCFVTTNGGLRFFRNTGSASNPSFNLEANTFGLNVVGRSKIRFCDIDADGDTDAFIVSKVAGDSNFNIHFQKNTAINQSAKIAQTILGFSAIPTQNGATYTITGVTGGASGNPVIFNTTDPSIATISGNVITIKNVGVCKIIASQVGNATYSSANNINQTLTVVDNPTKITQIINGFSTIPFQSTAGGTYVVSGVTGGSSGFPVVFTSSDPSIASVYGNVITLTRKGVVNITASQAGNHLYTPATDLVQVLTIGAPKIPQTISGFMAIPDLVVGQTYTITGVTGGSSGNPIEYISFNNNIATVSGNVITAVSAGIVTIVASQRGNEDFENADELSLDITITNGTRLNQSITGFAAIPRQRVGQTITITSVTGGASGNPVVFTSSDLLAATVSGNVITFLKPGLVTITATQAGNATYVPALPRIRNVNVSLDEAKGFQNISGFRLPKKMQLGSTFTIAGTVGGGSGNPIVYTNTNANLSISGNIVTAVAVGFSRVTANQAGNGSFNLAGSQSLGVEIIDTAIVFPQVINGFTSIPNLNVGDTYTIIGVTGGASGNPVIFTSSNPAIVSVSGNVLTAVASGAASITASQAGNTHYLTATNVTNQIIVNTVLSVDNQTLEELKILIYPNPAIAQFTIKTAQFSVEKTAIMFNSLGQKIKEIELNLDTTSVDCADLTSGIYFVVFRTTKGNFAKKVRIN